MNAAPPIRYRTDSAGRRRPLCQDVLRNVSVFRAAGEPCRRYASGRAQDGLGLLVCPSHAGRAPEPVAALVVAGRGLRDRHPCPSCGCSPRRPCTLVLPGQRGTGACAPAGSQPWLDTCSGCLTPELRAAVAEARAIAARGAKILTAASGDASGLERAEVGMCFRVEYCYVGSLERAEERGYRMDRAFRRLRSARLFAISVRRQKGKAEIRYERSRRFEANVAPTERAWARGPAVG
jgi:hypothetical protein